MPDLKQEPEQIPRFLLHPPWKTNDSHKIITEIEHIGPKSSQTQDEINEITSQYIQGNFTKETWTRLKKKTDGSAKCHF